MTVEQKIMYETLFKEFGLIVLTKEQMIKITSISIKTLDRHREKDGGCEYRYEDGIVYYPLHKVVMYLDR